MRVNVYAEEMTHKVEIITKEVEGHKFTGLRFYLELPVTLPADGSGAHRTISGPFIHRTTAQGVDDDSSAVTFWGKRDLRAVLRKALVKLDAHYAGRDEATSDAVLHCLACDHEIVNGSGDPKEGCEDCATVTEAYRLGLSHAAAVPTAPLSRDVLSRVLALAKGNTFDMGDEDAIEAVEQYLNGVKG